MQLYLERTFNTSDDWYLGFFNRNLGFIFPILTKYKKLLASVRLLNRNSQFIELVIVKTSDWHLPKIVAKLFLYQVQQLPNARFAKFGYLLHPSV